MNLIKTKSIRAISLHFLFGMPLCNFVDSTIWHPRQPGPQPPQYSFQTTT